MYFCVCVCLLTVTNAVGVSFIVLVREPGVVVVVAVDHCRD